MESRSSAVRIAPRVISDATIYNQIVLTVSVRLKDDRETQKFTVERMECQDGWLTLFDEADNEIAGFQLKCVAQWKVEPQQMMELIPDALTVEEMQTMVDLMERAYRKKEPAPMPKRKPPKKQPYTRDDFLKLVKKAAQPAPKKKSS